MYISAKFLVLLLLINSAPPLVSIYMGDKWNSPIDSGLKLYDGRFLFGTHKTFRGLAAALLTGTIIGLFMGFPWHAGLCAGILSMAGDLFSSFIKRRAGKESGTTLPVFDQFFEGFLPLIYFYHKFSPGKSSIFLLLILFCILAYTGAWFLKIISHPKSKNQKKQNNRKNSLISQLREIKSCKITTNPLHHFINFEDAFYYHFFMKTVFKALGIYEMGVKNALNIKFADRTLYFPDLPGDFNNYSILFLSDLHIDALKNLPERIIDIVGSVSVDLCILGGDYRASMHGPYGDVLATMRNITKTIKAKDGIYAVLGNHDCIEMVPELEKDGISVLLNESVSIEKGDSHIRLVGIDDPHYYKCHDLDSAFHQVPKEDFIIFTAHSPVVYKEAQKFGSNLYLCGHTHAGQIQIKGIGPVFTHTKAPRKFCHGIWNYKEMTGYTSSGVGVSGIPVRFLTHGEVVQIRLKKIEINKNTPLMETM